MLKWSRSNKETMFVIQCVIQCKYLEIVMSSSKTSIKDENLEPV